MTNQRRYPGMRFFEREDAHLFFGRSRESEELFNHIVVERGVLLFGKSGTGKTSLLQAGVFPKLEYADFYPLRMRVQPQRDAAGDWVSPCRLFREALHWDLEQQGGLEEQQQRLKRLYPNTVEPPLWAELKACRFERFGIPQSPVLVFDQFEEFFRHPESQRGDLSRVIADLLLERIPEEIFQQVEIQGLSHEEWLRPLDWKVVFAIRSDYLSAVEELSRYVPSILRNRYQLQALSRISAQEAIVAPAQVRRASLATPPFSYSDTALEELLYELQGEGEYIESFEVQIICQYIEQQVLLLPPEKQQNLQITPDFLQKDIHDILNDYYEWQLSFFSDKERKQVQEFVEEQLIVEGTRVSVAEVVAEKKLSKPLLKALVDTRLVRKQSTLLGPAYELAHDTLVAPIEEVYRERKEKEAVTKRKHLFAIAQRRKQEEKEQQRTKRRMRGILVWASVVSTFLVVLGLMLWQLSERQKELEKRGQDLTALNTRLELNNIKLRSAQQDEQAARKHSDSLNEELQLAADDLRESQAALSLLYKAEKATSGKLKEANSAKEQALRRQKAITDTLRESQAAQELASNKLLDLEAKDKKRLERERDRAAILNDLQSLFFTVAELESVAPLKALGVMGFLLEEEALSPTLTEQIKGRMQGIRQDLELDPLYKPSSPAVLLDPTRLVLAENGQLSVWYKPMLAGRKGWRCVIRKQVHTGRIIALIAGDEELVTASITGERGRWTPQLKPALMVTLNTTRELDKPIIRDLNLYGSLPIPPVDMVFVQGGTYRRGCTPGQDCEEWHENARPVKEIHVPSFKMMKYEVSQALWESVMGSNPSSKSRRRANFPVNNISWIDAQVFVWKLNQRTGRQFRLPTEAEWEYAARGGQLGKDKDWKFAGSNDLAEVGWYAGNSGMQLQASGGKAPNSLGIYDLSGNVREWCADGYERYAYSDLPKVNPIGYYPYGEYVLRGGSWNNHPAYSRNAHRVGFPADRRDELFGLRLVESVVAPVKE